MALLPMQRIYIYALKKDRKKILELLQLRGVVEIADMLKEDSVFKKTDVSVSRSEFDKRIAYVTEALDILNQYAPVKKSLLSALNGREERTTEDLDTFHERYEATGQIARRIQALSKQIAEQKAEKIKLQTQIEMLTPWVSLDIPMNFSGTKYTEGFIGSIPNAWTLEEIYEKLAEHMPVEVEIISSSKNQTCIFVLCKKDNSNQVSDTLRAIEFIQPNITFDKSPAEQLDYQTEVLKELDRQIKTFEEEIVSYADYRDDLLFLQDYDRMRSEKYEVIGNLLQTKHVFILTGYVPEKDSESLAKELKTHFDVEVEITEPKRKDKVPVLLKNNGFSAPLEGTVAAFSPPGKGEMDPTMVMSLFYYMLFGLMLGDAGYGFIIVLGCAFALIKFRKTMEHSTKNNLKMYLYCGISTMFWGIVFGSYFGDIFDTVTTTFVNKNAALPIVPPLWFFPVEKPMLMLTFSMALGIIHLLTGLAMKGYQLAKKKEYLSIVYDVVFWILLLSSCVMLLLSMDMITNILGIQLSLPPMLVTVSGYLAVLAAIGIILTNGRESKNPFKRFLKGLYALYGISGYLSDVLSYSRILALGLATGVIGSVINRMAAMTADIPGGTIIFIIILVAGHAMNLGINALGTYVHTNRLQYVEFFGKFYEGGGRLFKPFQVNTKYYKFKESTENGNIK